MTADGRIDSSRRDGYDNVLGFGPTSERTEVNLPDSQLEEIPELIKVDVDHNEYAVIIEELRRCKNTAEALINWRFGSESQATHA